MATPNSYKDPYWNQLASATEDQIGLPKGLLSSIVTAGEKSNHDQVSEAGAKTVFQIIPATQKAAIKKYGIDPYLSDENAAKVAGLLLKDSLGRNGNDVATAVAEYHGGTNRDNWGPLTKAYTQRVVDAVTSQPAATKPQSEPQPGESTFQRVSREMIKPPSGPTMASIHNAYKSGTMSPEDAAQYEKDVNAGLVMLPQGESIKTQEAAPAQPGTPQGPQLPVGVLDAYISGKMSPEDKKALEKDIRAGDVVMPERYVLSQDGKIRFDSGSLIPTSGSGPGPVPTAIEQPNPADAPRPFIDKVRGGIETAANLTTGLTGGALGMAGGTVGGIAQSVLDGTYGTQQGVKNTEAMAMTGAQALTYQPRTEAGQAYSGTVGEALQAAVPVMPLTGELAMAGRAASLARPAVAARTAAVAAPAVAAAKKVAAPVAAAAQKVAAPVTNAAKAMVAKATGKPVETPTAPTPGTMKSGGSAGVDIATLRQANADNLPVPIKLTEGQATRSLKQQQFESEMAKNPEMGAPIQDRYAEQRQAVRQNFDSFIDSTGAAETTARGVGQVVDEALKSRLARDKAEVRVAYKNAEKAGEMEAPVTLSTLTDHLNENGPQMRAGMNDLGVKAKKLMVELGAAKEGPDGLLIPQPVPIKTAVLIRRGINEATTVEAPVIRQSSIMKGLVDDATNSAGGKLYREANALRAKMGTNYENNGAVKSLLGKKPGTNDRSVALEDVFHASILKGSLDDVRHIRKVLQTEGAKGTQAWKELQGATLRHIEDQATSGVGMDTHGNQMISPAKLDKVVRSLDADGKLDFVFGKQGAEQVRLLNDVSRDIFTSPVGSVNHSNTASVLLAAMDMAMSGTAGVPLPIMSGLRMLSKSVKDRKLKARIEASLRNKGSANVASNN